MSSQPVQQNNEETTQEEQSAQASNEFVNQLILLAAIMGIGEAKGIRDAYAFFAKNRIDPEKLLKDPHYRAQIKKDLGRLNFWEKGAIERGRSKYGNVLDGANRAIKEIDVTNEKLVNLKIDLIKDYSAHLQNLYGLDKKEIEAIILRAKYSVHADPNISMQDFLQREAQGIAHDRIAKELKKEKLDPVQKEARIQARLSEIDERFSQNTAVTGTLEKNGHIELANNCKQHLEQILSTNPPAVALPQPSVTSSSLLPSTPQPPTALTPPLVVPPPIISSPQGISFIPIPGPYSAHNIPIPTFGGFRTGINILGSGFGKLFGGMSSFIGRRGLGRFMNLAGNLGKRVINRALDAFMPGLGMAVGKINDILKSILGIDVEGLIVKGAVVLVGIVGGFIVILPIIIGIGVLSSFTGDKPMIVQTTNEKSVGWNEFNRQFLSVDKNKQKLVSWSQFEIENLVLDKKYLSLDPNRHDDVKK